MTARIAVFGGTFDPIHVGHLAAVQDAADTLSFDRVLFVPNSRPPHKTRAPVTAAEHRVAMVRLSLEDNPRFELSMVEFEREGPSYTLDTLRILHERFGPGSEIFFLTGCDALADLHTWHGPDQLLDEFQVVVMDRPTDGEVPWAAVEAHFPDIRRRIEIVHVAQFEISSEEIRRRVLIGRSIRYHVVPAVQRYIRYHRLYQSEASTEQ